VSRVQYSTYGLKIAGLGVPKRRSLVIVQYGTLCIGVHNEASGSIGFSKKSSVVLWEAICCFHDLIVRWKKPDGGD
jgi:hypothetical protein